MKTIAIISMLFLSSISFGQGTLNSTDEKDSSTEYREDGKRIEVIRYHENGTVKETGFFKKDGTVDGTWRTFDEDGTKLSELTYVNGKRHGELRVWNPFGNTYLEVHYENDRMLSADRYVKEQEFAASKE